MDDNYAKQLEEQVEKLEQQLQEAYTVSAGEKEVLQLIRSHYEKSPQLAVSEDAWIPNLQNSRIILDATNVARLLGIKTVYIASPGPIMSAYSPYDAGLGRMDEQPTFFQRCRLNFKKFIHWLTHFEEEMQG